MLYEKIKELSKFNGISIRELEIKAELGNGTIGGWNESSPTVRSLKKVADILECTVDELLEEDTDDYEIQTKKG